MSIVQRSTHEVASSRSSSLNVKFVPSERLYTLRKKEEEATKDEPTQRVGGMREMQRKIIRAIDSLSTLKQ